jgi:hypothetical protein
LVHQVDAHASTLVCAISLAALARLGEQLEDVVTTWVVILVVDFVSGTWGTAARIWSTFTCSSNLQQRPNHSPTTVDVLAGLACTTRLSNGRSDNLQAGG